jgi:hypothetical protein
MGRKREKDAVRTVGLGRKAVEQLCLPIQTESRSQWPCSLRHGSWSVGCWDRGLESRSRHGCLSASFCVILSCVGTGLAMG